MILRLLSTALALTLVAACSGPTAPDARELQSALARSSQSTSSALISVAPPSDGCAFSEGVSTCTSVTQQQITESRIVYGGCVAGPTGVPGRSVTTYEDTYLVTTTTTTRYNGRSDHEIGSDTTVSRELISSVQISRTCEPL